VLYSVFYIESIFKAWKQESSVFILFRYQSNMEESVWEYLQHSYCFGLFCFYVTP